MLVKCLRKLGQDRGGGDCRGSWVEGWRGDVVKSIGVLGGMSGVATGEYYRRLNEGVNAVRGGHAAADVVIYSVDFAIIEECVHTGAWDRAGDHLVDRARRLERAGAEFLLLATNTMHRVADRVEAAVQIPFVHIVDVTAAAAVADGARTLGLLGTAPVMSPGFYPDRFARHRLEIVVPDAADRALVDAVIFEELTRGVLSDRSRQEYQRIITDLVARGAQGIVLGCTEISLLITAADVPGTKLYDTTALHVDRAVQLSLDLT